jgi:hypothetical protein
MKACTTFVLCSQYVLFRWVGYWPVSRLLSFHPLELEIRIVAGDFMAQRRRLEAGYRRT